MINQGIMSSATPEWPTPQWLFDALDSVYHFTLDPCSTHENAKCEKHFTKEDDGLSLSWKGERVFMNPPYGKEIFKWVQKCFQEFILDRDDGVCKVALLPSRTDTRWFHGYVLGFAEIHFINGRLKFGDGKGSAPFPSLVAAWGGDHRDFREMSKVLLRIGR